MAINLPKKDVVMVGLGAAGGAAVLPLARAGLDIVALEAGDWLQPRDFPPDELKNNVRGWPQAVQKANREVPTHRPNANSPNTPRPSVHPLMNAVGGTSLHFFAESWRLNPWDFRVVSETTRRYGAHRIPKGSTVEDWPLSYEDLEPYYDIVEWEIGVAGKAGNVGGKIDPAGNVFEGQRRRDYPMPPLRGTEYTDQMAGVAKKLGWHPFPQPAMINSVTRDNRAPCAYHGFCSRGGCHVEAKNSTAVTTIPKALATKRVNLVTRAIVTKVEVDERTQRATGVTYVRAGEEYFQPADVVIVSAAPYENSRLLLLSKSRAFANGLGNNKGQVGKHYMSHYTSSGVLGLFPHDLNMWYGTPAQGIAMDDWADDNWDHANVDFIGGGSLCILAERRPIQAATMSTFKQAPQWGSAWKKFVKTNADRWQAAYMQKTTLPYETNVLDLDPSVKDPLGQPVIRITAEYKDNERKLGAFMQDKAEQYLREAGAIAIERLPMGAMATSTHAYGGTRMGTNKDTNVCDAQGFLHECPNVAVLGASLMGTSGARNPTQTVQALAWRTADYLTKNFKTIAN